MEFLHCLLFPFCHFYYFIQFVGLNGSFIFEHTPLLLNCSRLSSHSFYIFPPQVNVQSDTWSIWVQLHLLNQSVTSSANWTRLLRSKFGVLSPCIEFIYYVLLLVCGLTFPLSVLIRLCSPALCSSLSHLFALIWYPFTFFLLFVGFCYNSTAYVSFCLMVF